MSSTRLRDLLKPIVHVQEISKWRLNDSDLPPCVCSYLRLHYDHRSWVTWTHRLWVFLRISTTWVDTGTPSFQTVVIHQQQKKKRPHSLSVEQKWTLAAVVLILLKCYISSAQHDGGLPAGLWARLRVTCTVGLWPRQRCAEIVGVRLVVDGAEDQTGLVSWWGNRMT